MNNSKYSVHCVPHQKIILNRFSVKCIIRRFSGKHGEEICDVKRNFMFVKVHKAGGTTATCIFQRFGYEHNLTFVLPMNVKSDVGWPNFFKREDFIPSTDGTFNVLVDHAVYHRKLLDHIMPSDTVYIAILRHPLAQLRSTFNWYGLARRFRGLTGADPVASFLKDPKRFQIPHVTRSKLPFTHSKNFMAYDLGFPPGLFDDQSFVEEFVQKMSREIDLVLILEYFHESLVLLRRMMCWKLKDILYNVEPKNLRKYKNKSTTNSASLVKNHRQWSNVDYQLYDYFNATLWQNIQNEDNDFHLEVRHFENVLQSTTGYCTKAIMRVEKRLVTGRGKKGRKKKQKSTIVRMWKVNDTAGELIIPRTAWHDEFKIDPYLCLKLKMEWQDWEYVLKKKHKLMPQNGSDTVRSAIQYNHPKVLDQTVLSNVFHIT
ncbi:galactose-3-O-sulfotransferase 2-like [Branchiostoma lanceolatum]|uniref:galactose-3-O-sulfotransferase 2-like n=1 Tax=Branchiostoma lanceolatum TaxID=7740 RepID=UPI0034571635